ncbi:hypothetical protein JOQ06_001759, partial [Pogonophryne albipinna]
MLEVQVHGVRVDVPQVPEADLAFGLVEWGLEKELHRDGLVVRHPQGIAPRLEFSTKTTIIECLADAEMIIYPNIPMRPLMKRNRKHCSRPRSCSPQRRQPPALGSRRGVRASRERTSRSPPFLLRTQSLPPHSQHLARLRLDSAPQHMLSSCPGASGYVPHSHSAMFTSSSSSLTRSSSIVRYSPTVRSKSLSNGLVGGISQDDSSSSETQDPPDYHQGPDPPGVWGSYREQARHS